METPPDLPDGYDEDDDGPEARMWRQRANEEAKWSAIHAAIVEYLLPRIGPRDAQRALIPFRRARYWGIPNWRRYRG